MLLGLTLLEAEVELPFHPIIFGLVAFVLLLVLLIITVAIGRGRPHS